MKRIRALWDTTAIRLSLIYTLVLGIMALAIIFYMTGSTIKILRQQFQTSIDLEIQELGNIYQRGGISRMIQTMERRARAPSANLYVVADTAGQIIAGNVMNIQTGVLDRIGWTGHPFGYSRFSDKTNHKHHAVARVFEIPNGMRILIGRDVGERETIGKIVTRAIIFSLCAMLVLGVLTWWFVGRRALKRIDSVSLSTNRILAGDRNERLPISGGSDEFDRLSSGMNAMLDRINQLDDGLKQVSDNIAHDLKTPITRLRNKVDAALHTKGTIKKYRETLSYVVDECDVLVRTFDALLMISRVESGSTTANFSQVNLSEIVAEMSELYLPTAEDLGFEFLSEISENIEIRGNRELLGQALANLIDNAMKYSGNMEPEQKQIDLILRHSGDHIEIIVADHGPGIPVEQRNHVLDRYSRLEKSRSQPGNGLGLSLVKAVVNLHGGKLVLADNEPGLKVVIELPSKLKAMS